MEEALRFNAGSGGPITYREPTSIGEPRGGVSGGVSGNPTQPAQKHDNYNPKALKNCNAIAQADHDTRVAQAKKEYDKVNTNLTFGDAGVMATTTFFGFALGRAGGALLGLAGGYIEAKASKIIDRELPFFFAKNFDYKYLAAVKHCSSVWGPKRGQRHHH